MLDLASVLQYGVFRPGCSAVACTHIAEMGGGGALMSTFLTDVKDSLYLVPHPSVVAEWLVLSVYC